LHFSRVFVKKAEIYRQLTEMLLMHRTHSHCLPPIALAAAMLISTALLAGGCSSASKKTGGKTLSGTDEQIFIGDTIEKNYDPNVIMKRGEAFFEREEYAEALVEYQHFLDLHRAHVLAPYAQFRLAEAHFKMARTIDRDPEPVYKALAAFEKLRREFPGSRYDAQALQKIQECHEWLAQTHLFVGQFYYRRKSYLAAAHRFELIIKEYPDMNVAPDALYYLALSWRELGADDWARDSLILLAEKYPNSQYAEDGRKLLAKLGTPKSPVLVAKTDNGSNGSRPSPPSTSGADLPVANLPLATKSSALTLPSADGLGQRFTPCRIGAWC
jgi:outer membrane protein assembly factor BamD